ncbi:PAS/PAC sensor signal transduction histidine kinase [Arcobacter nitrofigilis DSM 7299]|uniref:histidine kinase n=1 Tax=Arcobacter nitrofigilis (strain ATCC 33309 / DSM 7299 / CCUG 15893 / LMG 7604 / NCTC 12251 / CI) TaxID=572480 RepID=D5V273_ARCNC|nr:ABC transporter substrate-binding protein [Arcobacter nitrofigilis]ADG92306.1 PAS/PAC sensor signal transduction histidine kinase [Arcobacter nitrofigilis DSM 7299]
MKINKLLLILLLFYSTLFSKELEKISLQLNWKYQFEFAGFITAYEKGYYKDIGLDVDIREFTKDTNVIDDVTNKKADFGIFDLSLFEYYNDKKPLMLLANYMKRSGLVFVTKQDIITPYDFKNKVIMASKNELEKSILSELLKKFSIKKSDFKKIEPHHFSSEDFINGKVDIITAYLSNELYEIKKSKIPYNIIDPSNYDLATFSLNLFALKSTVDKNPEEIRKFIDATDKGWEYAFAHKKEVVDIIYNKYSKLKSKDALLFEANEVEKLMMPNIYAIGSIRNEFIGIILKKLVNSNLNKNITVKDIVFKRNYYKKSDILSTKNREYLQNKKKINVCIDPNWMPLEKIQNGRYVGISREYMDYFQSILHVPITLVPTNSWSKSLEKLKEKKCDILSLAMDTKDKERYINFTKPYISSNFVIVTKSDQLFVPDVKKIIGKRKLAVVKNYAITDILKEKYNSNNIIEVNSIDEGLEKVLSGEVYGYIDCLSVVGYKIQKEYTSELKIVGKFDEALNLSIGVRKDDLELLEIFNKLIENFPEDKKQEILNKWVNIKFDKGIDYSLLWKVIIGFLVIILLLSYRQKELINKNKKIEEQKNRLRESNNQFKRIQKELKQTLKSFEMLISSTMDSIFVIEKNICIDINENAIALLGYKEKKELIGKNILNYLENSSRREVIKNLYIKDEPFEINIRDKDNNIIPSLIKVKTTTSEGKSVYVISLIDLREIKEKEMLFFKQSKMAAMGEMIGNIAHQWRQPLSVISAVSTGLKLKLMVGKYDEEDIISSLDSMNESAQYLSQTIDDFRNFYKSDKEKTWVTSNFIIDKNKNLIISTLKDNGITLVVNNKCENLEIDTYLNELIQATVNIFNNAKDALNLNNQNKNKFIFFDVFQEDKYLVLSIKDNAGGIPKDIIDKVFEPYFTTKHKSNGTGIGLYMTHQIIENHINGKIELRNEKYEWENKTYKGANFLIYLPIL